ncbi:MBL fold metallo-hydrolase [archaeon]|jgi:hydroxyacylglutathione hydrolase|nr:MBL fold metallo-hydrolase [archaeon]MBT4417257.1 MBL fold metallo-hydrolase [archaeon]
MEITHWLHEVGGKQGLTSNVFLINKEILIDLGTKDNANLLLQNLKELNVSPEDIKKVIFTHIHYDHTGDPSKFPKAEFFASKEEIEDLAKYGAQATVTPSAYADIKGIKLNPLTELEGFNVIHTPGHSRGSICLEKDGVLISGDTLFNNNIPGRIDLPTAAPELMKSSLEKIKGYKILCPGHGTCTTK